MRDWRLDELSDFYQQGTGGTDPGIDQDELEEETSGAVSGEWPVPEGSNQAGPVFSPVFSPVNPPLTLLKALGLA